MFFDNWPDIWRVLAITGTAYLAIVATLRMGGKRSLAKLNAFDFVVTIALGSILASVILLEDVSLSEGVAAFLGLAVLQFMVTWSSRRFASIAGLVRSAPRILLRDGRFLDEALDRERVTRGEVEAAIRKQGQGRIEDVNAVVLETDGTLSVITGVPAAECTALRSVIGPEKRSD